MLSFFSRVFLPCLNNWLISDLCKWYHHYHHHYYRILLGLIFGFIKIALWVELSFVMNSFNFRMGNETWTSESQYQWYFYSTPLERQRAVICWLHRAIHASYFIIDNKTADVLKPFLEQMSLGFQTLKRKLLKHNSMDQFPLTCRPHLFIQISSSAFVLNEYFIILLSNSVCFDLICLEKNLIFLHTSRNRQNFYVAIKCELRLFCHHAKGSMFLKRI